MNSCEFYRSGRGGGGYAAGLQAVVSSSALIRFLGPTPRLWGFVGIRRGRRGHEGEHNSPDRVALRVPVGGGGYLLWCCGDIEVHVAVQRGGTVVGGV
jgi:hypothetical protein